MGYIYFLSLVLMLTMNISIIQEVYSHCCKLALKNWQQKCGSSLAQQNLKSSVALRVCIVNIFMNKVAKYFTRSGQAQ